MSNPETEERAPTNPTNPSVAATMALLSEDRERRHIDDSTQKVVNLRTGEGTMMRHSRRLSILFVILGLFLVSCTSIRPYRCDFDGSPARETINSPERQALRNKALLKCATAAEETDNYRLGVVEFDDIGNYWYREQADEFIELLSGSAKQDPQILVVFIHGWNRTAKRCDYNASCFRKSLEYVAHLEKRLAESEGRGPRDVTGLFVGWRGAAYRQGGLSSLYNWTSYWKRKGVAHSIGRAGALTELLVRAEAVLRDADRRRSVGTSRMIAIGHSFGGAVLFDAVSQVLMARAVEDGCRARLGDLVILANPAFEASHIEPFRERFTAPDCRGTELEAPSLAIFTARNDSATRYVLRVGQQVGTWWERHRPSRSAVWREVDPTGRGQGVRARKGVGHYDPYFTHWLDRIRPTAVKSASTPDAEGCICPYEMPTERQLSQAMDHQRGARSADQYSPLTDIGNFQLLRFNGASPSPLWVIPVRDHMVIDSHNRIYTADFIAILATLMAEVENSR